MTGTPNRLRKGRKQPVFRSGLEQSSHKLLSSWGLTVFFEAKKIAYFIPKTEHTYTPDFYIEEFDFFIETKGLFDLKDRQKHILIKQQHPELDIRFVFQNAHTRISKGSRTTYAMWCEKNGFQWAHKVPRKEWFTRI